MRRLLFALAACLFAATTLSAQQQTRPLAPALRPYTTCKLQGGPDLVEVTPLVTPKSVRTVQTRQGNKQIQLLDGARLVFSYADSDLFATAKIEELPAASYAQSKDDLISNFEKILSSDDLAGRNYGMQPTMHGFEIYGLDKKMLTGSNLGIYVMFDNNTHVVTTMYFLNAEAEHRKFATLAEYAGLRDVFLSKYTACVRAKLSAPAATPPARR
ncbi:MAG TPA: hypothetical protein VGN16_16680 [Acidobacteriaceae bacterium]|jgi:hypothetical protein